MRIAILIAVTSWALACSTGDNRATSHLMTKILRAMPTHSRTQTAPRLRFLPMQPSEAQRHSEPFSSRIRTLSALNIPAAANQRAPITRVLFEQWKDLRPHEPRSMTCAPALIWCLYSATCSMPPIMSRISIGMWKTTPPFLSQQMSLKGLKCPCILFLAITTTR